jgi:hypothetical protein
LNFKKVKTIDSNYYILYSLQSDMKLKIHSIFITSILAFALIGATGIPTAFENVFAQGEGSGGMTGGDSGTTGGMTGSDSGTTGGTGGDSGMTGGGGNTTGGMTGGDTGTTTGGMTEGGP